MVAKFSKFKNEDLSKPLFVDFFGEDSEDYGGLTREFFAVLCDEVSTALFHGPSNNYYPHTTKSGLKNGSTKYSGK